MMFTKLLASVVLFCSAAYAATDTKPVGTATVRGSMRIDGNQITSDATLFDGSTVETEEASATLNMGTHTIIIMAAGTRGIVHEDYIKLEQGKIDLKPTCGFVVEADQARITPNSLDSHSVISISNSSASVMVQNGEFLILDKEGRVLHALRSGNSQSFGTGTTPSGTQATYAGTLSIVDNHHLLTLFAPDTNVTYELQGKNTDKIQGNFVQVNGTIDPKRSSILAQVDGVISPTKGTAMCAEKGSPLPWILAGAAAAAAGAAAAIVVSQPSTPASK
jgi:hypothetical protein